MSRDEEAWRQLLARHEGFARAVAGERLRRSGLGAAEAEDAVQEVWLRLLEGKAAFNPDRAFRPYLLAMVLNAVRQELRTRGRRAAREAARGKPARSQAPEEPLLRTEEASRLEAAMAALPPRERLVLRWVYWEDLSYPAVGRLLGISPNGVGPLLSQARSRLRGLLEKGKSGPRPPSPAA